MFPGVIKNVIINRVWLTEGRMLLSGENLIQASAWEVSIYLGSQVQVTVQEFALSISIMTLEKAGRCVWYKTHSLKALSRKFELKHFKGLDRCGYCSSAWWGNPLSQRNFCAQVLRNSSCWTRAKFDAYLRISLECTWELHSSGDRETISKAGEEKSCVPQPRSTSNRDSVLKGNSNNPSWKALWKRKFPVPHLSWEEEVTGCVWEIKMVNGFFVKIIWRL